MIKLDQLNYNYLDMGFNLSLHNLLKESFSSGYFTRHPNSKFYNEDSGISYEPYDNELKIKTRVGNKYLDALSLVFYPDLCKSLRECQCYPYYTVNIKIKTGITFNIIYSSNSYDKKSIDKYFNPHRHKNNIFFISNEQREWFIYYSYDAKYDVDLLRVDENDINTLNSILESFTNSPDGFEEIKTIYSYHEYYGELLKISESNSYDCLPTSVGPSCSEGNLNHVIHNIKILESILKNHKEEKLKMDENVNNLIVRYGKKLEIPKYEKSEICVCEHCKDYSYRKFFKVIISGVTYYNDLPEKKYHEKQCLYKISGNDLLRRFFNSHQVNESKMWNKELIGGVINTPILIFRMTKNWKNKGKVYYGDIYKKRLVSTKKELQEIAKPYVGNNIKQDIFINY